MCLTDRWRGSLAVVLAVCFAGCAAYRPTSPPLDAYKGRTVKIADRDGHTRIGILKGRDSTGAVLLQTRRGEKPIPIDSTAIQSVEVAEVDAGKSILLTAGLCVTGVLLWAIAWASLPESEF
jgi:hypothetical protein